MNGKSLKVIKQFIYVFNGDADGIIATHQLKLAHAKNHAEGALTTPPILLTGVKRDINLLARLLVEYPSLDYANATVYVCDVSLDVNADALHHLLALGATVYYFDHHRATRYVPHPRLHTYIDTAPTICTALIVDAYLQHEYRGWALAAAFGDGLPAEQLNQPAALSTTLLSQQRETHAVPQTFTAEELAQLTRIGRSINYNAYGDSVADLHYSPEAVLEAMDGFLNPFACPPMSNMVLRLESAFKTDLALLLTVRAAIISERCQLWTLPDLPESRRANGSFANQVAAAAPHCAHVILTPLANSADTTNEQFFGASIRAPRPPASSAAPIGEPLAFPGADDVAAQFATGGGRKASAGINLLPQSSVEALCSAMRATFG